MPREWREVPLGSRSRRSDPRPGRPGPRRGARDKGRLKRGGDRRRSALDLEAIASGAGPPDDLLDLDEALQRLEGGDPGAAALVKLRLFAGLTLADAASALGVPRRSADRDWAFARAWLFKALGDAPPGPE